MSAAAESAGVSAAPAADAATGPAAPAFEQTLAELEALVAQLESGDLPLEEALRTFEQGVRLTRDCQSALSSAQQKVQLLRQRDGSVVVEEFDSASLERLSVGAAPPASPEP